MAEHNVVFTTLDASEPWSLATYESIDGYKAWRRILEEKTPQEKIIETVKDSALRGRVQRRCRSTSCAIPTSPSPAPATTGTSCDSTPTP
jgi:hypothetical protein